MRKTLLVLSIILILVFSIYKPEFANAEFANAYLRLNFQTPNTVLSGTVCAQPSSAGAGVESSVAVIFPNNFTISANTSNWKTDVSRLPSGATAWPGIGSPATNVSGQSVTFSSSDLTSNNLYCFNFTSAASRTGNLGNSRTGTITTENNSGSTINSITYSVAIATSNQIGITASIDPHVSDLPISLQSLDSTTQFDKDTVISYQITYGSILNNTFPISIHAEWTQGTIKGNPSPSVDIINYVAGSATDGINSTAPVVDLVNNKITWTFNSFPANSTGNIVTFKLKTNSSYSGNSSVNFSIKARTIANTTVTPDLVVNQSYYHNSPASTPTPTSVPASTPTPTPTSATLKTPTPMPVALKILTVTPSPTLAPTPAPVSTAIKNVEIRTISDSAATIVVDLSRAVLATVVYGKSLSNLSSSVSAPGTSTNLLINLPKLSPQTTYYFKVILNDAGKMTSDIFSFKTAAVSIPPEINLNTIIVTSNNNVIFDTSVVTIATSSSTGNANQTAKPSGEKEIVVPQKANFQFKFSLKVNTSIKKIKLILRKRSPSKIKVLGANTYTPEIIGSNNDITLTEIQPGVYSAVVNSDIDPGEYEIIVSSQDEYGNLTEQKLTNLKVSNPFTVYGKNNYPREGARIFLYMYNENKKKYLAISPTSLNIENPSFTNSEGISLMVLPKGKYKAVATDIGYADKTVLFTIQVDANSGYPIVYLQNTPLTLNSIVGYYWRSFNEIFINNTLFYIGSLNSSVRFFDLTAGIILFAFVVITLFAFSKKHHVPMSSFISYFLYLLNHKQKNDKYLSGTVFNQYQEAVPSANVYLIDVVNEQIIQNAKTNNKGAFFFRKLGGEYLLMIMKKGYKSIPQFKYEDINVPLKVKMEKLDIAYSIRKKISHFAFSLISMSFESLILLSIFFEVVLLPSFGIKTIPFLAISVFNLILWILHRRIKTA